MKDLCTYTRNNDLSVRWEILWKFKSWSRTSSRWGGSWTRGSLILKVLTNLLKSIYLMVSYVCGNCVNNLSSFIRMSSSPRWKIEKVAKTLILWSCEGKSFCWKFLKFESWCGTLLMEGGPWTLGSLRLIVITFSQFTPWTEFSNILNFTFTIFWAYFLGKSPVDKFALTYFDLMTFCLFTEFDKNISWVLILSEIWSCWIFQINEPTTGDTTAQTGHLVF